MKLPNDNGIFRYSETHGIEIKVGRYFAFDFQPNSREWYAVADILPSVGANLYSWRLTTVREYVFNELFEKLKEDESKT
jgi:hypothetical protein